MTKIEYGKCVKLMEKAIRKVKQAQGEYEDANTYRNVEKNVAKSYSWETEQRKADQHYGEAIGINQALATLGFKHDRMKYLLDLL